MSYGYMPFAVQLDEVREVFGCRDPSLLKELSDTFERRFSEFDEMAIDCVDLEAGELVLTMRDVLTQVVMGGEYSASSELGFMYGYGLELICWFLGDLLPNYEWDAIRSAWIDRVDHELGRIGVPENVLRLNSYLTYRHSCQPQVPIPKNDDFPYIGYMTLAEINAALVELTLDRIARVPEPAPKNALLQLRSWLESSADQASDLVCFYH